MNKKGLGRGKPNLLFTFTREIFEKGESKKKKRTRVWSDFISREREGERRRILQVSEAQKPRKNHSFISAISARQTRCFPGQNLQFWWQIFSARFLRWSLQISEKKFKKNKINFCPYSRTESVQSLHLYGICTVRTKLAIWHVFWGRLYAEFLLGYFFGMWFEKNKFWRFSRPFKDWLARLPRHLVKISTAIFLFKFFLKE